MDGVETMTDKTLLATYKTAEELYTVYCRAVGGKAFNGEKLPVWREFMSDPKKQVQVEGWLQVAEFVLGSKKSVDEHAPVAHIQPSV